MKKEFYEFVKTLFIAVVIAVIFRSLAYEPFHIPSGSMKSNLLIGDYLFVSKFSYGYSRFSFPLGLPFFHGRIFEESQPKRGDVVVFRPPGDQDTDFIKRLIGLPGDRIQVKDGIVYLNDKPLPKEYVDDWMDADEKNGDNILKRYRETLPEGKSYLILNESIMGRGENTGVYVVPKDHYFMMGDNRDHSFDSRFQGNLLMPGERAIVAYVPAENLVGRAELILFSWKDWFSFRTNRFFKLIP